MRKSFLASSHGSYAEHIHEDILLEAHKMCNTPSDSWSSTACFPCYMLRLERVCQVAASKTIRELWDAGCAWTTRLDSSTSMRKKGRQNCQVSRVSTWVARVIKGENDRKVSNSKLDFSNPTITIRSIRVVTQPHSVASGNSFIFPPRARPVPRIILWIGRAHEEHRVCGDVLINADFVRHGVVPQVSMAPRRLFAPFSVSNVSRWAVDQIWIQFGSFL